MKTQKTIGTVKMFRIPWGMLMLFAVLLMTQQSDGGWLGTLGPYRAEFIPIQGFVDGMTYLNGNIYVIDNYEPRHISQIDRKTGAIVATWNTSIGGPWSSGIANNGTTMYACNRDTIFTVSLGTPPNSVCTPIAPIAEYYPACDLVYGDGLLWAPIYISSTINKYDPVSGAKIGCIPSPSYAVYAMAFDGTNLILADVCNRQMWKVSTTGNVLDSWAAPSNMMCGMAYDFSTETLLIPVPEPATLSILVLGGLALLRRRRRKTD